jgi:hypothetical protein
VVPFATVTFEGTVQIYSDFCEMPLTAAPDEA